MSFNWIDPTEYSFNCILLMDKYIIRQICTASWHDEEYLRNLSISLAYNPVVVWYRKEKAPEVANDVDKLTAAAPMRYTKEYVRKAEYFILDCHDWAVVYVYPEVMNKNCSYIYNWDKERLFELTDFTDKMVLDVSSGTGRLTFAAAEKARYVYASEPADRLREFMREKITREQIHNVTVLDGFCACLPYEDNTFDIVMSGHVVGDDYDREIDELEHITKNGVWILDRPGEDDRKRILRI